MGRGVPVLLVAVFLLAPASSATAAVTFGSAKRVDAHGNGTYGLLVTPLDRSGTSYVVAANLLSANVSVFKPNRDAGLDFNSGVATNTSPTYLAAYRISPASDPDLAVTNNGNASFRYLNFLSGGGFQILNDQAAGANPNQIVAGDFDGNTRDDLAVANFSSSSVTTYSSDSGGIPFDAGPVLGGVPAPVGLAAADINKDGDLDLIIGATGGIYVALGQPGFAFAAPAILAASPGQNSDIAVTDFNGDGDPDLAVASADTSPGTRAFLGAPGASFGSMISVFGNRANGVDAADVTGDGLADVVSTDVVGQVAVLEGNGQGGFASARSVFADNGATLRDVATTDLDGDGDREILLANQASPGQVIALENIAAPEASVSPVTLAFAAVPAGMLGPVASVTLSNPAGGRPLQVQSAAISGGDDFVIAGDECSGSVVPRGGSCRVGVRFAPGSPGEKGASLRLVTDAPGTQPAVSLAGTGSPAPAGLQGPPGKDFSRLVLALLATKLKVTSGKAVTLRFATTLPASLTLSVLQGKKRTNVATVTGRVSKAGTGSIRWNGKVKGKAAPAGSYTLSMRALSADGQLASANATASVTKAKKQTKKKKKQP
jgi:hypothetical protein